MLVFHPAALAADLPVEFFVKGVNIDGAHNLKKKKIKSVLTTVPPPFWRIWVKSPLASEGDISDESYRITQLYKTMGYYHAKVTYDVDVSESKPDRTPKARVTYIIEEGAPAIVDRIDIISGDPSVPLPLSDLHETIPLKTDEIFEEEVFRSSRKVIERELGAIGYPLASVDETALVYAANDTAVATYTIDSGMLSYFGDTTVIGDAQALSDKILKRAITYESGEVYDITKVETTQRSLYNLDIFRAAVLQADIPDPETGVVPMTLELKPKKKQRVKLGVGYGLEDGVRLKAGYAYRNPMHMGGMLYLEAQRTDLYRKALVGYNQPYFWDSRSAFLTESGIVEEILDSYKSRELFGTARFTRDMGNNYDTTLAYFLEYSELLDLDITDPEEQAAYREDHTYLTSSLFGEIVRDTSNSTTDPETGSTITCSLKVASQLFGSGLTYVKPIIEISKYFKLPGETILAGRIRFESIDDPEKNEEIPIFNRLFLGGSHTVRGYGYQMLGPLDATGNPLGGQSTALANIELRRPIFGIVTGVLFLDMGMVDRDSFQYNDDIRYSAGAGLRVSTPLGPLRLDYGYKLNPQHLPAGTDPDDGLPENRWRIHFDIGHAF
jgi:outer membrane protein assembly complex protein YaeT